MLAALLLFAAVRFEHGRGPGAESCPDAQTFASKVEERLGASPFDADAPNKLSVQFNAEGDRLEASVVVTGEEPRLLEDSGPDCAALADRTVAAVAQLLAPAPPPPTMNVTSKAAEPPPRSEDKGVAPRFGLGVLAGAGFAPSANFGGYALGGLGFGPWSLDLEGRWDFPATEETRDTYLRTALRMGQLALCTRKGPAFGCAIAGGGVLSTDAQSASEAKNDTHLHLHLGLRAGLEQPLTGPLALRIAFDVLVPLTRTSVDLEGLEVWITPPFGFAFSLGPVFKF